MMTPKPCRSCRVPILMVRKAENHTSWMPVAADPVDPVRVRDESTVRVLGHRDRAYSVGHLRETLELRLSFERDAPASVDDFAWHPVHSCESGND
jgi:hypothetical protein